MPATGPLAARCSPDRLRPLSALSYLVSLSGNRPSSLRLYYRARHLCRPSMLRLLYQMDHAALSFSYMSCTRMDKYFKPGAGKCPVK